MNIGFCSAKLLKFPLATTTSQNICNLQLKGEEFVSKLLDRRWAVLDPEAKIHQIVFSAARVQREGGSLGKAKFVKRVCSSMGDGTIEEKNHDPSFYVVRDDLLHPLVNGNKARKLDALLPLVEDYSVTDVVTCGGCQSAHATAVAVSCAERGLRSHLLLRGEQPKILTGYNLISKMYGNVTYVPRSEYANREEMLKRHADLVAGSDGSVVWFSDILDDAFPNQAVDALKFAQTRGSRKVVIVNEGAGDAIALLGVIRLVKYLSQKHLFGRSKSLKLVVDAGTGTTAVGLGLGALFLGLPWEISAVMLADTEDGYREQEKRLISDFKKYYASELVVDDELDGGVVNWVDRSRPRKFGNVMEGEVEACQRIAQQTGVLVDPIYTLAAWELATLLGEEEASSGGARVAMLHTGGTLGMFGLAQRYKSYF